LFLFLFFSREKKLVEDACLMLSFLFLFF